MQERLLPEKWAFSISYAVLFISIIAFAFTGNYVFLVFPPGYLFFLLLGINWKTAYMFFLFCIPVSIDIRLMNDTLGTSLPDEPMMWSFLLLFVILWARNPRMLPKWWWKDPLVFIVALQYLWMIITVIYSREPLLSLKFMAAKTWFLVAFFIFPVFIFSERKDYRNAFLLMLIPLIGSVLFINARHAALGFSFRKVEKAIGDIYYNHVDYSTVLSMFLPLLFVAIPLSRGKSWVFKAAIWCCIFIVLPAIYLTYARAALLAVIFGLIVALTMRYRLVNFIIPVFYIAMASLVIYVSQENRYYDQRPNFERTYMRKHFTDHIIATFRGQDMSSMERLYRWIAAVRMSNDELLTGYGPNSFVYYYKPYAVSAFKTYVSRNPEKSTTHNYYLYMLVEQGLPAMILYAVLIMAVLAQAQRTYHRFRRNNERFYRYCTMGVAMMFGAGFVNNFFSELIEHHKVGALFYLSIALIVILRKKSLDIEKENKELKTIEA